MWIIPVSYTAKGKTIEFGESMPRLPLPDWTGVPVALPMEVDAGTLARSAELQDVGVLYARDEDGDVVHCAAVIDATGNHTCETDSILMLVQCGPFEFDQADEQE